MGYAFLGLCDARISDLRCGTAEPPASSVTHTLP